MKVKKYTLLFVILLMTLSSLATINIYVKPAQAQATRNLTVQSTPIVGINFTIAGYLNTTNTTVALEKDLNYTVRMPSTWMNGTDQYTFGRWEDNSTNRVRVVFMNFTQTIIAFYVHVKVYVNQPLGYIPGVPVGDTITADIMIETTGFVDAGIPSIVGWGLDLQVDPDVISINTTANPPPPFPPPPPDATLIGSEAGYVMYDYDAMMFRPGVPSLLAGLANPTTGYWDDVAEIYVPLGLTGWGDYMTGGVSPSYYSGPAPLVTFNMTSKSETVYSLIDLIDVIWLDDTNTWHPVDEVIDGHYNEYIPHNLTVESTPIDGINFTAYIHAYDSTDYTTNTSVILPEGNRTVTMPDPWPVGADQYNFVEWEDTSTNPQRTINLTSNTTIIATYERALKKYNLTINSTPITGVNFTIDSTTNATDTSVILWEGDYTVTMNSTWMNGTDKYIFRYWENSSIDPVRTIDLTSNTTITATYELAKNYTLTVNSLPITGVNFTIDSTTNATDTSVILLEGSYTVSMSSFWMNDTDRYNFLEWEDTSTNPQRAISLTSNTTITATYEPSYIKVYVNQSLGYIPGQPAGQKVTVDIIIEVNNITDNRVQGIVGWAMDVQVDPDVLNITSAIGAGPGYFLWEFANLYSYSAPSLDSLLNATAGFGNITELLLGPPGGAGDLWSGYKLVTLEFTSKSETAYSKIDLVGVYYMTDSTWQPVDEFIDGQYNPPHLLTVESTPIDGINFTINTTDYTTNQSVRFLEGNYTVSMPSTWMVSADQYNFVEWEDNSTNPVRVISLTSNTTITATYKLVLAPVASFIFSPTEPIVTETVTFNASASDDPDGTIVSYSWTFGDGDSDSGAIVEHAYTAAGDYNVTLTVTDNDGLTHTITKTITVKEAPPSGIPLELYLIAAGVISVIIIAIVVYYLKFMRQKPE